MIYTPRTDAHSLDMETEDFDVELAKTYELAWQLERELTAAKAALSGRTVSCCNCNTMAEENAMLREAIKKACGAMKTLDYYVGYPSTPLDVVLQFRDTLCKLQLYVKRHHMM